LAKRLHDAALADAAIGEGALLGGMLTVRLGAGLRGHIKSLMERLDAKKIPGGGSLYTAFAYLAVMHAERAWTFCPAQSSPRRSAAMRRHCKRTWCFLSAARRAAAVAHCCSPATDASPERR
jgi:hypothetical protein